MVWYGLVCSIGQLNLNTYNRAICYSLYRPCRGLKGYVKQEKRKASRISEEVQELFAGNNNKHQQNEAIDSPPDHHDVISHIYLLEAASFNVRVLPSSSVMSEVVGQ